jgi:8-oxo-dGTP diphosphatase
VPAPLQRMALRLFRRLPSWVRLVVVRAITPSFTVGAICVVERADGALLCVRHSYRRRWGFPGGLLQRGESPHDGGPREVLEEVGLDVELVGEPAVVVDPDPRRVDVVFRARPRPGADLDALAPRSPEIVELRWFPPDELPELQHEASGALVVLARATGRAGPGSASARSRTEGEPGIRPSAS